MTGHEFGVEGGIEFVGIDVIPAPDLELRIMRYELADWEWTIIRPMLPDKPRGVPRMK